MRRHPLAASLLAILVIALLASCSGQTAAVTPTQAPTPTPSAVATASPATAAPTETPVATASLTPDPTPTVWEMATPGPAITVKPKDAPLTVDDYFIINKNVRINSDGGDCYGLIDAHGKVILPFRYFDMQEVSLDLGGEDNLERKVFYFAQEYLYFSGKNGTKPWAIYSSNGKKATSYSYEWYEVFQNDRIVAKRTNPGLCGVLDSNLKPIVNFKYQNIIVFDDWLAAIRKKGTAVWIDFLDKKCRLQKSLQIGSVDAQRLDGEVLLARGLNGKLGFIDQTFAWCCEPEWDSHVEFAFDDDYFGPEYIMKRADRRYIVNKYGKVFIPKGVKPSDCYSENDKYAGHDVYRGFKNGETILFTDAGRIIFHYKPVDIENEQFFYADGMVFINGKVFDLAGKELLPGIHDIYGWDAENQLFEQMPLMTMDPPAQNVMACYTKDGKMLPLPKAKSIMCVSKGRFIVEDVYGNVGYYDEKGNQLDPPAEIIREYYLEYDIFEDGEKCGLMDANGNIIIPAQFDWIDVVSIDRGLYEVYQDGFLGIIDLQGNWIWYTSVYNELTD